MRYNFASGDQLHRCARRHVARFANLLFFCLFFSLLQNLAATSLPLRYVNPLELHSSDSEVCSLCAFVQDVQ